MKNKMNFVLFFVSVFILSFSYGDDLFASTEDLEDKGIHNLPMTATIPTSVGDKSKKSGISYLGEGVVHGAKATGHAIMLVADINSVKSEAGLDIGKIPSAVDHASSTVQEAVAAIESTGHAVDESKKRDNRCAIL